MVILYVDPSEKTRFVRSTLLRTEFPVVHESASAEEAVEIAQQLPQLDVLVAEGLLGEYTGFDLRDAIREKFPDLRAVFTSREDLSPYAEFIDGNPVLTEPFEERQLLEHVRGVLPTGGSEPDIRFVPLAASDTTSAAGSLATAVSTPATLPEDAAKVPPARPEPVLIATPEQPAVAVAIMADNAGVEAEVPPVLKPGTVLGSYVIQERFYNERTTETYRALQQGVAREVALVMLKPEFANDADTVAEFLERQRIKASISHHRIAPLYESVQTGSFQFYTRELPHGRTLQQWQASGRKFNEKILADLVAGVADAMSYATQRGYHYRMLTPRDIFIDDEHNPSIVNVFRPAAATPRDFQSDTKRFIALLRPLTDGPRARHLLDDLGNDLEDWEELRERAHDFQEEFRERSLLKRADTKEAQDIQASQSATIPIWVYALTAVIIVGLIVGIFVRGSIESPNLPEPVEETMREIPDGPFLFQKNDQRELPTFWIDTYEVTIGQYAEFLAALKADPAAARQYNHPDQPESKTSHQPALWDPCYTAATTGALFNNQRININTPVFGVDWWDAYAYAKWKGRRLPTEEEWEKAARGTDRRIYPWGNTADAKNANLGLDYQPKENTGGNIDGSNLWCSVNEIKLDVSPYGVIGMGGNVEEWTGTWASHPDFPDFKVPLVRGGHFALRTLGSILTDRTYPDTPDTTSSTRGFRTASDTPPTSQP
jgi:formylglycine-generating enzyme required for sulfatase activity/CheY-like chemotaxis protein